MTLDDRERCEAFLRAFPHLTKAQIEALGRHRGAGLLMASLADMHINDERERAALNARPGGGQ